MKSFLKKYFFSGLVVFLPLMLTIYVCIVFLNFAENIFGKYLRSFFIYHYDFYFWGIGLLVLLAIILLSGFLITNYFGRSFYRWAENGFVKIPIVGSLYPAFKEVAQFIFKEDKTKKYLAEVVLVQWPLEGTYTVAFLTNKAPEKINQLIGQESVTVLIPTVPNPFTGFMAVVPKSKVQSLSISVEDAIKMMVSGGVVDPTIKNGQEVEKAL